MKEKEEIGDEMTRWMATGKQLIALPRIDGFTPPWTEECHGMYVSCRTCVKRDFHPTQRTQRNF